MSKSIIAASLISAGVATLITTKVVEKILLKEFDERMQRELDASVIYLEQTNQAEPTERFEEELLERAANNPESAKSHLVPSEEQQAFQNQKTRYDKIIDSAGYFGEDPSEVDHAENLVNEGDVIMAISTEEFMSNESEYSQSTLTYYADGGVLDEEQEVVADWREMIGNAVPPFGMLSGEPHVVYLRNNQLRMEFEVIHDTETNAADLLADPSVP